MIFRADEPRERLDDIQEPLFLEPRLDEVRELLALVALTSDTLELIRDITRHREVLPDHLCHASAPKPTLALF
jgi:hypothetical protein